MNTEHERIKFEAACHLHAEEAGHEGAAKLERDGDGYADPATQAAWWGWREGRATLQSQDREDAERYRWLRNDCLDKAHYGELAPVVFNTDDCFKHDDEALMGEALDEAIDHARRAEEEL